jgi:hypothetical protein
LGFFTFEQLGALHAFVFSQRNKNLLGISYKLNKTTMSYHWAAFPTALEETHG